MEQDEQRSGPTLAGWLMRLSRQRRWVMACILLGWAAVVCTAWLLPAQYRSETLILVEQQRVPEHYVEPNVAVDLQQRLRSMSEQILSRTRLVGIIEKFHLYDKDRSRLDMQGLVERMRKDIGIDLVRAGGAPTDQISAFKVSYSAANPVVAQQVTAELTSLFIEENLRNRQQLSEDTTSFLENQLDAARKSLETQELRLREFKSRYLGQLPEQTTTNLQILTGLQNRLQSANDSVNQGEQQKLYLQSLLSQYQTLRPGSTLEGKGSDAGGAGPDQKLASLKSQLREMKAKYTSRHPDVIRLEQEISAAEKLKPQMESPAAKNNNDASSEPAGVGSRLGDTQAMPAALQIASQLKAVEFDIANHKAEMKRIETEINSYQARLNLAPAREQELAAITRDHEQSRAYYESLLAKRNQSEMATNLEKRQQGEQFRMIDPPSLPQRPFFPNRLMFSVGGLAFGVALGLALVVLRELVDPKIFGEEELSAIVASPMLVVVPPVHTPADIRRRLRHGVFDAVAASGLALLIPAVTFLLYYKA
jgi:succinoglycan biosynthesis transport protein ExoP